MAGCVAASAGGGVGVVNQRIQHNDVRSRVIGSGAASASS
eukprot:CAMPEP_0197577278 /NCGR_PEP_ID=MMETSP1326-20131121/1972_1 /TAXON_ID=1155430 /ORGANISM="Genus nov. species nov., Strain RCC2288" /LENGTH=39 /DNA_ID= /DNA_START= /DNA_END= /DNA_ORIENTATION=